MNSTSTAPSSADTLSGKVSQAGHNLKEAARDVAGHARQGFSSTASKLKQSAAEMAEQRRAEAADQVGRVGNTLHETARSMEEEDPNISYFAHRLADRIDHVADYVRNRDMAACREDAADMARRHPVAFFGGLFVAGLVVGNLVKAGATATRETYPGEMEGEATPPNSTFTPKSSSEGGAYVAASPAGI